MQNWVPMSRLLPGISTYWSLMNFDSRGTWKHCKPFNFAVPGTWEYWILTKLGCWEPGKIGSRPSWGPGNVGIVLAAENILGRNHFWNIFLKIWRCFCENSTCLGFLKNGTVSPWFFSNGQPNSTATFSDQNSESDHKKPMKQWCRRNLMSWLALWYGQRIASVYAHQSVISDDFNGFQNLLWRLSREICTTGVMPVGQWSGFRVTIGTS